LATIIGLIVAGLIVTGAVYVFYSFPPPSFPPDMSLAPIESIPFDGGWIGLLFIFVNGFLLSYVLIGDGADKTERLMLSIGLGFGLNFAVLILIGVLWEFNLLTIILTQVILLLVLGVSAFYRGLRPKLRGVLSLPRNPIKHRVDILTVLVIVVIGTFLTAATYKNVSLPATEWDSLAYGVNYARIIFEKHSIPLIAGPSLGLEMAANYPPGVQLIGSFLYVFAGSANDFYFRILSPIFGLATIIATYKFAITPSRSRAIAVFAALTLSAIPLFWEPFIQETYFMALTYMLTLSAFFFFKAYESKSGNAKQYEIVGTLFGCFAALTSYIGLFSFGLLLLYAVNAKLSLKRFASLITLAALITIPWYARNIILLGNPIYPFFGIGKYLDPFLRNSTVQHFQGYSSVGIFFWLSIFGKLGIGILVVVIAYLTFSSRKNQLMGLPSYLQKTVGNNIPNYLQSKFLIILPSYLFLVGLTLMTMHIPFPRYLIIAFPCFAVVFSAAVKSLFNMHNVTRVLAVGLVFVVAISSVLVPLYMNYSKPAARIGDDEWAYLTHVFEEADAWKWINNNHNSPTDARIAMFDIKEYYIERDVMPLDGNESAPLYRMNSIEEAINFLQEERVTHILSVPWASPGDSRMPNAYKSSILTRYLGDPRYLPPIYVGANGTTVYSVGPIDEKEIYEAFARNGSAPPLKHVTLNLTLTNSNSSNAKLCLPIPVDYRNGTLTLKVDGADLYIRLWNPQGEYVAPDKSTENQSKWSIDRAGYFTLTFPAEEVLTDDLNVTLDWTYSNPIWELSSP
jgi:hypothetical protein